ncbi:MAG: hypothetical protein IV092_25710, partial [Burkholderiaceae bacterium]|nr:hypothetical protein [Burkholderiaceae bacterium]
ELIKRSGCEFRLSVMPRARIWRSIESSELEFSMSGITNEARDKYAGFAWCIQAMIIALQLLADREPRAA